MNFADTASQLCGQCALLLGWRPDEFWAATPAELGCVLKAVTAQSDRPPGPDDMRKMMAAFPDAPTGGE